MYNFHKYVVSMGIAWVGLMLIFGLVLALQSVGMVQHLVGGNAGTMIKYYSAPKGTQTQEAKSLKTEVKILGTTDDNVVKTNAIVK